MLKKVFLLLLVCVLFSFTPLDKYGVKIALLKYNGGGDWYANPTSLSNLIEFCNKNLKTTIRNLTLWKWEVMKSLTILLSI